MVEFARVSCRVKGATACVHSYFSLATIEDVFEFLCQHLSGQRRGELAVERKKPAYVQPTNAFGRVRDTRTRGIAMNGSIAKGRAFN